MTTVLKTVGENARGFKSYTVRQVSDGFSHLDTSFQWGGTFPMSVTSPSVWPSRGFLNTFPPGLDIGASLSYRAPAGALLPSNSRTIKGSVASGVERISAHQFGRSIGRLAALDSLVAVNGVQ